MHYGHMDLGAVPKWLPVKGALKAHTHISLYESNTLQEQDAVLLFHAVIP